MAYDAVQQRREADQQANDLQAFERQRSGAAADTGEMARDTMASNSSIREAGAKKEAERRKDAFETQALLNQINLQNMSDYADQRARDAANLERDLEDMFGADWRQDVALRVFGPDEFPQKREDETPAEYEQRLEDELIDRMIDPETGEIRNEYKDDPELTKAAEWAKARYDERKARDYVRVHSDPNSTPEEKAEATAEVKKSSFNEQQQTDQEASIADPVQVAELSETIALEGDAALDRSAEEYDEVETEAASLGSLMPPGLG
ncbi:MAG: hypothetical protein WBF53_03165 [Litorimonas sp.]